MSLDEELEAEVHTFEMCRTMATAALRLLQAIAPDFDGPPLPFAELETFRLAVRDAYLARFTAAAPKPNLTLVN
jgi:hypothetical protein